MPKLPRRRPSLEILEDRRLPATFGVAWPDPQHLTLSFAPDGALMDNAPSVLNQALNARMATSTWQLDILRAYQSWAVLGNLNIGLVNDTGAPSGQPGPIQGNPAFGDIRVGAHALTSDAVAEATPFDLLGNAAGDVVLNSAAPFGNGPSAQEDLYTAMLHEAGHTLGLDHNTSDPNSVMNETNGLRAHPSASDIAAVQALYGVRQPDPIVNSHDGTTFKTAAPLTFLDPAALSGLLPVPIGASTCVGPWTANADVTSLTDKDIYSIKTPAKAEGPLEVVVRTSGISLLTPQVTIYDAGASVVASALSIDPLHNDVTVTITNPRPGAVYYAKVNSGQANVFGIGAYRIAVGLPTLAHTAVFPKNPVESTVYPNKGIAFAKALDLKAQSPATDARWPFIARNALATPTETDFYRVQSTRALAPGGTLLVTVWGLQTGGLSPNVTILDASNNPLPTQVVSRDPGSITLQVQNVSDTSKYVIKVSAADPAGTHAVGGYFLGAEFRAAPLALDAFVSGTLDASRPMALQTLNITSSRLLHFDLSGTAGALPANTALRMTLFDQSMKPVFVLTHHGASDSTADDVLLAPGTYVARFVAATRSGAPLPKLTYSLKGAVRGDLIGPSPIDTTLNPVAPAPTPPPPPAIYVWTTTNISLYNTYISLTDPYGNPWFY